MTAQGPVSIDQPVEHGRAPPDAADVVVIGGGVAGVMTAWHLARAGKRVVLVEKGRIAGEQSSRNWGWIRSQGRDPVELPLSMEANRIWRDLKAETNEDLGLRRAGTLYLIETEAQEAKHAAWLPHARAHGLDTELLSAGQVARMLPEARASWRGALWTPSDMRAEPWVAVPALARVAVRAGAVLRENCAVRRLDIADGRVAGVMTEAGRIAADSVVLAGGAWSSLFLRAHGVELPQLSVLASACATGPLPEVFQGGAVDDRIAFRRREDGGYTLAPPEQHMFYLGPDAFRRLGAFRHMAMAELRNTRFRPAAPKGYPDGWGTARNWSADESSPFEAIRVLDPAPDGATLRKVVARFAAAFPGLGEVPVKRSWAGMIDTTPDQLPVIDRVAALPGLVLLTGLSGHGFGIGPGVGRVVADLAMGRDPGQDLSAFALSRFARGAVKPGPHL